MLKKMIGLGIVCAFLISGALLGSSATANETSNDFIIASEFTIHLGVIVPDNFGEFRHLIDFPFSAQRQLFVKQTASILLPSGSRTKQP